MTEHVCLRTQVWVWANTSQRQIVRKLEHSWTNSLTHTEKRGMWEWIYPPEVEVVKQTKLILTYHLSTGGHKGGLLKQAQAKNNWVWTLGTDRNEGARKQPEADKPSVDDCWCCCYVYNELINSCGSHSHRGVLMTITVLSAKRKHFNFCSAIPSDTHIAYWGTRSW